MSLNRTLKELHVVIIFFLIVSILLPFDSAHAAQIATGTDSMALKSDGTAVLWGHNGYYLQGHVPAGLNDVIDIAMGGDYALALKSDGTIVAWGYNNSGQTNVPTGLNGVVGIAAGESHSLALKADGTVVAWGYNNSGQTNVPAGLNGVVAIAAGKDHSLVLKSDGTVVAWGSNDYGQTNVPAGLNGVVGIAAGYYYSLALKSDGTVIAWGNNNYGQTNVPAGLNGVVGIAAGSYHCLALKSNGTVVAWGDNSQGQTNVPGDLTGVVAIATGTTSLHSLALKSDGTVVAWGRNYYGQSDVPAGLVVLKDTTPPNVQFSVYGNAASAKAAATQVTISDTERGVDPTSLQYAWSQTPTESDGGWTSFTNGDTLTKASGDGNWYLHIRAKDRARNVADQVSAPFVLDNTKPTLVLRGSNPMNVPAGSPYAEPGATATDTIDGNIPASSIAISGDVDTATLGTYPVLYQVTDHAGNSTSVTRDVYVISPVASGNADLRGLALSSGALTPALTSGVTSYTASVANSVSSLTITASVNDLNATIKVNGSSTASGQASGEIRLNVGNNLIIIIVTAQNGTTKTYNLTVNRDAPTSTNYSGPTVSFDDNFTSTDGNLTLPPGRAGEVSLGNELKVSIPAGATNKEMKISLNNLTNNLNLHVNKEMMASPIFEILKNFPDNFFKPVTLSITFDPTNINNKQTAGIFYYDDAKKVWIEAPGSNITGNQISVEINHFTKFAVFTVPLDISGHWAGADIQQAVTSGMLNCYPDGTFKPDHTVTRAEFAVMLMNALKLQGDGAALKFTDNEKIGAWAQKAVAQAVQAGIITGYEDGTFHPDAEITRSEMAAMIAKAMGQLNVAAAATDFADDSDIPEWAKGAVAAMKKLGIIEGKGTNNFAPGEKSTRAEAVTVILRMLSQNIVK